MMRARSYPTYLAQGGDGGSATSGLGHDHGHFVRAIHLSMLGLSAGFPMREKRRWADLKNVDRHANFWMSYILQKSNLETCHQDWQALSVFGKIVRVRRSKFAG